MIINPGDVFVCCMCRVGTIEIPLDADQSVLDELSVGMPEGDAAEDGFLCSDCAASINRNKDGHLSLVVQ